MTDIGFIRYCFGLLTASLLVKHSCKGVQQCLPMNSKAEIVLDSSSIVQCSGGIESGCPLFIVGGGKAGSMMVSKVSNACCFDFSPDTCYLSANYDAIQKDLVAECYNPLNNIRWVQPTKFKVRNEADGTTFTVIACITTTTTMSTPASTQAVTTETSTEASTLQVSTQASTAASSSTVASTEVMTPMMTTVATTTVPLTTTTTQPITTTNQPATTTIQAATTTIQPATTTIQQATTTIQPATTTIQPITTTMQPITTTIQPAITTMQPITTTIQPATTTIQPATTTIQPATTTIQPITTTIHPNTTTIQPITTTMQPATITIQPATITIQPATATAQQDPKNTQPDSTSSTSADQSSAPITTGSTISDAKPTSGPMLTTSVPNLTASVTIATSQPEVTTSVTQSTLPVATTTATSWALTTAVITSATLILATMEMKVRKEIEEKVDIFAEAGTQFFNTAQKVLEKLTELFDTLADAVNNLEVSQVSTIDLPEAHIQYANLPDVTYWRDAVKERPGDRVRLLELTPLPVNKRKKRSSDSVHFVYALFFFDLHKMLALHSLQPKTTSAMWTPTTHSLLYPSEEAPYIRIQLEEHGGKSIAAKLKFQINMTADDMFEKEIPQKMSRAADDSIPRSYACLRRVDTVNGTFSPHDCSSVTTDTGMVTCSCNKTGFFTVSAQVATQSRPEAWDLLCLLISILGLILLFLATIALVGMHGEVINDRIVVQINLVLSLFLFHCVLFFERSSSNQKTPCVAVMFLIHFFMLATACFAVVESFTILSNLHTEALKWKRLNKCPLVIIQILAGWVLPLTIAAITISVNLPNNAYLAYQQHGTDRCWFKADSGVLVAAVTVPIATCFSICFVVGLVTLCLSLRAKRSVPRHKNLARRYDVIDVGDVDMPHERRMLVEHILACVSLLVPWIFYFIFGISNLNTSLAMMYWSTVLISTQGIFVFVAYIIVSKDTRKILVGKVQYPGQLNLYWHGPQRKGEAIPRKASSRRLRRSGSSARSKIGLRSPKRSAHTNFGKW